MYGLPPDSPKLVNYSYSKPSSATSIQMHSRAPSYNTTENTMSSTNFTQIPLEKGRAHSQKKLTLTVQNKDYYLPSCTRMPQQMLKKQAKCGLEKKGKFMSLKNSVQRISNGQNCEIGIQNNSYNAINTIKIEPKASKNQDLADIKRMVEQKLIKMSYQYSQKLNEQSMRIKKLESLLIQNNHELHQKNQTIEKLQNLSEHRKQKQIELKREEYIKKKLADAEIKIEVISLSLNDSQSTVNKKLDHLNFKINGLLNHKINDLRKSVLNYITNSSSQLQKFENMIVPEKCSQKTTLKSSLESFCEDSFFYPIEDSECISLLTDIVKHRGEIIQCWIDNIGCLRLEGSNGYLYGRSGEKLKPSHQELDYMVKDRLICVSQ